MEEFCSFIVEHGRNVVSIAALSLISFANHTNGGSQTAKTVGGGAISVFKLRDQERTPLCTLKLQTAPHFVTVALKQEVLLDTAE